MDLRLPPAPNVPPLLHGVGEVAAWREDWWVVHTKARQEKALAETLLGLDIPYFLPLWEKQAMVSGKLRRNWLPVFTSYLFVNGSAQAKTEVLRTHRAAGVYAVAAGERERFVKEIGQVAQALAAAGGAVEPCPLRVGQRCRVRRGAFVGAEGALVTLDRERCRVVLVVSMLSQAVSVEMALSEVEPL